MLEDLGGDTSGFAARHLTPPIANEADLVITMSAAHRNGVLEMAPRQLRKTFTLTEASALAVEHTASTIPDLAALRPHLTVDAPGDIPDPIGQSPEHFADVGAQILRLLPPIIELCQRSVASPNT